MDEQVDVVVVGMGPGGEDAAERLAEAGLEVVGVDNTLVGGECPYWGCVPSKMMIRAADLLAEARRVPGMAGDSSVTPDWAVVARRIRDEATDDWNDAAAVERFEGKGGRFVRGTGRLTGRDRVEVDGRAFVARRAVVLNTGDEPWAPPIPGLAELEGRYWSNRDAVEAESVPSSLVLLGGGAIGVELGQAFARFGARVSVVEAAPRLLAAEEPESSALLAEVFERDGIAVHAGVTVTAAGHHGGQFVLELEGQDPVKGEALLVATGRRPRMRGFGLDSVGVDESARAVPVDDHLRVTDGVYAIGDMTGVGAFTHVSMYQADIVVKDILGQDPAPADYRALPRVTFTDPEIASVGMSEEQARKAGIDVRTGSAPVPKSARGWIHKAGNDGFIKLVGDAGRRVLVGATSAGPSGGEVLSMLTLAVHAEVPVVQLRRMIYAYPTFHRTVEAALADLVADPSWPSDPGTPA